MPSASGSAAIALAVSAGMAGFADTPTVALCDGLHEQPVLNNIDTAIRWARMGTVAHDSRHRAFRNASSTPFGLPIFVEWDALPFMAFEMAQPYTSLYASWYDFFISPAVVAAFRPCAEQILDAARPGAKLLSVGCGGGQTEIDMARKRTDLHVTGLDLSAPSIARATRRAERAGVGSRMRFVCADAQSQPFADAAFDVVFSPGSIKHWPEPDVGLRECMRVLRPGGLLLVMDADRGCQFDDVTRWLDETRVPRPMRPLLRGYFRGYVTGQGLALDDVERLFAPLGLLERDGPRRIDGWPAWCASGKRPD